MVSTNSYDKNLYMEYLLLDIVSQFSNKVDKTFKSVTIEKGPETLIFFELDVVQIEYCFMTNQWW